MLSRFAIPHFFPIPFAQVSCSGELSEEVHWMLNVPGLPRSARQIKEIIETGTTTRLAHEQADPRHQITKIFSGVYGIGTKSALFLLRPFDGPLSSL
jgi:hypothetical protein